MKYKQWYIAAALALLVLAVVCLYQRQTTSTVRSGYTQAGVCDEWNELIAAKTNQKEISLSVDGKRLAKNDIQPYMADDRQPEVKKITRSKPYKEIEKDLRDQLEANGTYGKFFEDMIADYMAMYVTKTLLIADIQKRGTIVEYNNGGGQSGYKKNEAVDMFNKTNAQMLKLLSELGLKANATIGGGDFDDEL